MSEPLLLDDNYGFEIHVHTKKESEKKKEGT